MQLSTKYFSPYWHRYRGATVWFIRSASAYKKWAKEHYKIGDLPQ